MRSGEVNRAVPSDTALSVVQVCPGVPEDRPSMSFVRRQAEDLRNIGVNVHEVFVEDRQSLKGVLHGVGVVRDAIREYRPEILHAQYGTVTALVAVLCGFRPLVVTFRGSDLNPDGTSSSFKMWAKLLMSQLGALRASRIVTVSEALLDRLWWKKSRGTVIPSGVDTEKFYPVDKSAAKRHLGWDSAERVIFFNAARNPRNKRLDLAMEVGEKVKDTHPNTRVHVLEGKTDPDEVPWILNACDVLLMLSDHEGSPNVVKEAMACNLPIVSFDVGDVAERLEGVAACRIVPRETDAVVSAVLDCFADGRRSDGRHHVDSISSQASAAKLRDVYLELRTGAEK